jgi:hypothetical protein
MKTVKLVAVFAENKPGQAAGVTKILADAGINIRWVTVASIGQYGVIKLLVNNPERACKALSQAGYAATFTEVITVAMPDKPGALYRVVDCLARHGINLSNTSGCVANNRAILVLEVENPDLTRKVLEEQGLQVLTPEEIMAI